MRWEKLPRPWTKEQCRRRYVEADDDIGLRGLSVQSGRAKSTLQTWCKEQIEGRDWHQQRVHFQSSLGTATQEKIIDKISDKISDELSEICTENYKVHKLARDYVAKIIEVKARQLQEDLKLVGEEKKKAIAQHSAVEYNQWSQALKRSTDAINEIRGIKYFADINAAADKLSREGYEIIDPSEKPNEQTDD